MAFFSHPEAASRYARYRPKVHPRLLRLVQEHFPIRRFSNAIDMGCGTGDSLLPLEKYADKFQGVDVSESMLEHARAQGLPVECRDLLSLDDGPRFDLLSTGMTFHWLDAKAAVSKFKAVSRPKALWLIYNFAFAGHVSSYEFNQWLHERYLARYPSPPRGSMEAAEVHEEHDLQLVARGNGYFEIGFDKASVAGYLTTQSNVERAVQRGLSYADVERDLKRELEAIRIDGLFRYAYTYQLFRYTGTG